MSRVISRSWMIPFAVALLIVLGATTEGQTPQQPNQDTLGALLLEVRGLRSAIEQLASVGPRVQLAMGRLKLQEQRINTLVRRARLQGEHRRPVLGAVRTDERSREIPVRCRVGQYSAEPQATAVLGPNSAIAVNNW
jgi:hypothetical protein